MRAATHKAAILKRLLGGERLISSDILASNANQYFIEIKEQGIELIEEWKPNKANNGKHKERRLLQTKENIERAKAYLNRVQGKVSPSDEVQESGYRLS